MHIISRKALRIFAQNHPDSTSALNAWYKIVRTNRFASFHELQRVFARADQVGNLVVFKGGREAARGTPTTEAAVAGLLRQGL